MDVKDLQVLETRLNGESRETRLAAASEIGRSVQEGGIAFPRTEEVNNHIHTVYSFSPYAPTMAAYLARKAGLLAVGIMDHDSVAGCREMTEAGKRIGIGTTVGFELRVNFSGTKFEGKKINSPDSVNIAYIAVHGIPHHRLDETARFLEPINERRNRRNQKQTRSLNELIEPLGIGSIDFYTDVYPLSKAAEGGSITERHILFALVQRIITRRGKGKPVVRFLESEMALTVPKKIRDYLSSPENPHYEYDLLGLLKSTFLPRIFIQPDEEECPNVREVVDFANAISAIPAYAYLGDVTESPTGDKKAEKFEDDYLDLLIEEIKNIGFKAVTYMPPRNTAEQLAGIKRLCEQHNLMQISGVDINSSRQTFNCPLIVEPRFIHLAEATWALIAHELAASKNEKYGLFNPDNPLSSLSLSERLNHYSRIGRKIDPFQPELLGDKFEEL